jgi:hypothetical protein
MSWVSYLDMVESNLLDWCICTGKVGQIFARVDFWHGLRHSINNSKGRKARQPVAGKCGEEITTWWGTLFNISAESARRCIKVDIMVWHRVPERQMRHT